MGMVADYLEALSPAEVAEIPAEVANIKLRRLCEELNQLVSAYSFHISGVNTYRTMDIGQQKRRWRDQRRKEWERNS